MMARVNNYNYNYLSERSQKKWKAASETFISLSNSDTTMKPFDEDATMLTKAFCRLGECQVIAMCDNRNGQYIAERRWREWYERTSN